MKRVLLFTMAVLFATFSIAQTQYELNMNAKKKYEEADKELNEVCKKILNKYKTDPDFIKNLKKAQKLWVQLRDTEMEVKFPKRESGYYGSVQPMCWTMYKEELTRERIKILNVWLDGIEEGDVCSGSIKQKDE